MMAPKAARRVVVSGKVRDIDLAPRKIRPVVDFLSTAGNLKIDHDKMSSVIDL
jgi:hypothetical protein